MESTGERLIPGSSECDLRNEHVARYAFAESLAEGRRILDVGCGVGYGAARLSEVASNTYALDIASEAVLQGKATYPAVCFLQGDCTELPFADDSIDLVVAFEVIEHLERWSDLIREASRVLPRTGVFLASTPNRSYYRIAREASNPFHIHEFECDEFRGALSESFDHISIFFENHSPAIAFTAEASSAARACFEDSSQIAESAHFFVAVCSRTPIDVPPNLAYVPDSGNVLREREQHIAKLNDWIAALETRHAETERNMSRELRRFPYRVLRGLRLAPRLPEKWSD